MRRIASIVFLFTCMSAPARSLFQVDLAAFFDTRTAPGLSSTVSMNSAFGVGASERFLFGMSREHLFFWVLDLDFSLLQFNAPSGFSLSSSTATAYGGGTGIQLGLNGFFLKLLAGGRNTFFVTEPSTNNLAFANVLAPEASGSLYWAPLRGKDHVIGLEFRANYLASGSTTGASLSNGYGYGGRLILDFSNAGVPAALVGTIHNTVFNTSSGQQTSLFFGAGLRFGAAVISAGKSK